MGILLAPHGKCSALAVIPEPCFLNHPATVQEDFLLTRDFVLEGLFHVFERIQILDFRPGAEFRSTPGHEGNIGVTAETPLFQVAVADLEIAYDGTQLPEIGAGFPG